MINQNFELFYGMTLSVEKSTVCMSALPAFYQYPTWFQTRKRFVHVLQHHLVQSLHWRRFSLPGAEMAADGRYWLFQISCTLPCFLDRRRELVGWRPGGGSSGWSWLVAARTDTVLLGTPTLSSDVERRQHPQQHICNKHTWLQSIDL